MGIATLLAIALAYVLPVLGILLWFGALVTIYFRGYLLPGTPELTARYLPISILEKFHRETGLVGDAGVAVDTAERRAGDESLGATAERLLLSEGVVVEEPDTLDLDLSEPFRVTWTERIERIREDDERARHLFRELFDVDSVEFTTAENDDEALFVHIGDNQVTRWVSRAAFLADVTAEAELRNRSRSWTSLDLESRAGVLAALRTFLDRCPACDGRLTMDEEEIESCCLADGPVGVNYRVQCVSCEAVVLKANRNLLYEADTA